MRALTIGGLLLSVCILGCSGSSSESTNDGSTSGGSGGSGPAKNPGDITYDTGKFDAPAGDSLTCFYLDQKTTKELSVTGATGTQAPGGHHILVYWIDTPRDAQHHTCTDAEMVSWHQIAGASGHNAGAEGLLTLPEGAALKVPEGKQLGIQSHYINATGHSEEVDDTVTIHTVNPSEVTTYVNYFAIVNDRFEVPPNGTLKQTTQCTTKQDLANVLVLGHMHEYGTYFKMETVDGAGKPDKLLYEKEWEPVYATHPPLKTYSLSDPLNIPKGTTIQQTCEWVNSTPQPLTFPIEMCVGFFYYFPDNGEINCEATPVP
jgi:hypothetical protein